MSSDLNSIWLDWRAKVPNGVPNPSNAYHLVLLKELCLKKGIDKDIVDNVMLTLEDVDDEKIKWKDKDGKDKETSLDTIKRYQYDKDFKSNKNKQLAVAAAGLDDKDKSSKAGIRGICKSCDDISTELWRAKNKDQYLSRQRKRWENNEDKR